MIEGGILGFILLTLYLLTDTDSRKAFGVLLVTQAKWLAIWIVVILAINWIR